MTIKCPHCGEICESDGDIPVGQHIECPFCANRFCYGKDSDSLGEVSKGEVSSEVTPEANKVEMRFCGHCGAKISPTASFCPRCGRNVLAKEDWSVGAKIDTEKAKADVASSGGEPVAEVNVSDLGKFQKLLYFLGLSLLLSVISLIVGCIDVKEYYFVGTGGAFVLGVAFLGIDIWLYAAVMQRKSWARKSFIVFTLLCAVGFVLGIQSSVDGNLIVAVLNVAELLITLYCMYLCFTKEVVAVFKPDSELNDARAVVNTLHCFGYWFACGLVFVVSIVWVRCYDGTDAWVRDCTEAAVAGSSSAREDLIANLAEQLEQQDVEYPGETATELVDAEIRDKNPNRNTRSSNSEPLKFARSSGLKILGKIAVGIAALIGALNVKFKNFLSKLKNE